VRNHRQAVTIFPIAPNPDRAQTSIAAAAETESGLADITYVEGLIRAGFIWPRFMEPLQPQRIVGWAGWRIICAPNCHLAAFGDGHLRHSGLAAGLIHHFRSLAFNTPRRRYRKNDAVRRLSGLR